MKTRTLLLLSVALGLAILLAGGVLLVQLSAGQSSIEPSPLGEPVAVGELVVVVSGSTEASGELAVDVELAGVDDDLSGIVLVTGDRRLSPESQSAPGRCTRITVAAQRCSLDFDVSGVEGTNRTLVIRRGDEQANWVLADA